MTMDLFPHPRSLTDQEIEDRLARIWDEVDNVPIGVAAGLAREQDRRAKMTAHERIALARSLAEERDAGRIAAEPDPIEIISAEAAALDHGAGYPFRETGLTR